jgi:L-threonylcarbamoyladenylate synthase
VKTQLIQVPPSGQAREEALSLAGAAIREGKLVAFPTETVYGLGASALSEHAIGDIFKAKGRPQDNPLIVHVDSVEMALSVWGELAPAWQEKFALLAQHLWPGPLTIIGPVSPRIPPSITAGLGTVGVRMPDHPVALGLIRHSGVPIAAPSANRSGRPSPTLASHVLEDLRWGSHRNWFGIHSFGFGSSPAHCAQAWWRNYRGVRSLAGPCGLYK